jgi:Lrp/AsnC family transcriptional regulator, regulator for asnA, asnC and gidA
MAIDYQEPLPETVPLRRLTPTDLKIVACLRDDPRCSVAKIASVTDIPESTVRNRLNRLIQERVIEIGVALNPLQLGFQNWVMIGLRVSMTDLEPVAMRLSERPEVYFVGMTTGSYNLMMGVVVPTNDALVDFLTKVMPTLDGVETVYTFNVLRVFKRAFLFDLTSTSIEAAQSNP